MKKGFYRSSKIEVEDNQGGVIFKKEGYYIIASHDDKVYFFLVNRGKPKWSIFENSAAMKRVEGKTLNTTEGLKLVFYNPDLESNIVFEGTKHGDNLVLEAHYEESPSDIWLDDTFEYIGTGESEV